ncbi:MAG: response regulator [Chitinophagaceae bacterium]|nr:response regulator [Chitinophagaceae bacterium]
MADYILMLEDDSDDRYFTESTLEELQLNVPIKFSLFSNELLNKIIVDPPSMIILGYNTYPVTGVEILKKVKSDSRLSYIPVVILSEDISIDKVREYYKSGANSVIKKPSTVSDTHTKIKTFFNYWMNVAEL